MRGAVVLALAGHWRRHPGQLLALVLGLAIATALWSGVQAINAEARASYDRAAQTLGQDRLQRLSRADGQPVPLADYVALRRAGYLVSPVIEGDLRGEGARLRLLGVDLLTLPPAAQSPALAGSGAEFAELVLPPGRLFLSSETAAGALPEDLPPLQIVDEVLPRTALTDISTAARLLDRADPSYLIVAADQPAGLPPIAEATLLTLTPPQENELARLTDSFHLNLTAFGLLAFAVGLFIVHSAIGLAFEQRRTTFRTLRALGVPLRALIGALGVELAALSLISGLFGILLGYLVAASLLPGVAGTLRNLYGAAASGTLQFDPAWALAGLGMALAGASVAAAQALIRVARLPILAPAQPRAWLLASARTSRLQSLGALALFALAAALALFGNSLLLGFLLLAALLVGAALALPGLISLCLAGLGRLARKPFAEWLLADTRQQLPGLSLALMALLLALAANIGVSTMVGSFRATFTGWLDQRLAAELYLTARSEAEAETMRAYLEPRTQAVLPIVSVDTRLAGMPGEVFGVADHPTYRDNWPLLSAAPGAWDSLAAGTGLLVNEQLSRRADLGLGDAVALTRDLSLPVVGIYSDYGNPFGQAMVGGGLFSTLYPEVPRLRMAVRLPAEDAPALAEDLRARFDLPGPNLVNQEEIKRFSLRVFEQTFLVTGALNLLTLGVAAFALLTSLLTLGGMRLPQLAPVWALGQTRATLARAEFARSLGLAALTFVVAVPTGLMLAWVLLAVVNVEAFGWRLPMRLFPADWLTLLFWALLAAGLAASWPAWRLARMAPTALLKVFAHER